MRINEGQQLKLNPDLVLRVRAEFNLELFRPVMQGFRETLLGLTADCISCVDLGKVQYLIFLILNFCD